MNKEKCGFLVFAGVCLGVTAGLLLPEITADKYDLTVKLQACEMAKTRLLHGSLHE